MSRFNLKSLQTRSLSALVLILAVLSILYIGDWAFLGLISILALISIYEGVSVAAKCTGVIKFFFVLVGMPYVIMSFACCYFIFENLGLPVAVVFLSMIWGSDIGAYFVGKTIGGAKMAPKISPNKTWAGFGGALVSSGVIGVIGFLCIDMFDGAGAYSALFYAGMFFVGAIVGAAGQGGDLIVSVLKRRAGVKDTGALIPGHGGLLDRIDSMLLAAPVYLALMLIALNYV